MHRLKSVVLLFLAFILAAPVVEAKSSARNTPIVKVVKSNAESVVNISTETIIYLRESPYWGRYGQEFDSFFDWFFGIRRRSRTHRLEYHSVGSGVIVGKDGTIVTNAHVVAMATNIIVTFNDGTKTEGRVMYQSPDNDLAVIKIDPPKKLKPVVFAKNDEIMIGETALAIGNPLGYENSVTVGIISGKNRNLETSYGQIILDGLLQTDAPINPGNSGGALFNLDGELMGVNVAVVANSQSIGFAVPIERVIAALENYERNKYLSVTHARKSKASESKGSNYHDPYVDEDEEEMWSPFEQMERMRHEMSKLFEGRVDPTVGGGDYTMDTKDDEFIITFDIKGMNPNKLNIDVDAYSITVSGERTQETESKGEGYFYSSSSSSFMRRIPLPEGADPQAMTSEIKEDTLIIKLPKVQ